MNETKLSEQEIQSRINALIWGNPTMQREPLTHLTRCVLREIIKQLQDCHYECEAGPLEKNIAFQALCELAEV